MRSRLRSRHALVLLATLLVVPSVLLAPSSALGTISSVDIQPPAPTTEDEIHVTVSGYFPDACWSVQSSSCLVPSDSTLTAEVSALDVWAPGVICALVIVPYTVSCTFGPLAAGDYLLTVIENHVSLREPLPEILTFNITVVSSVDSEPTTWARIKGIYR